MVRSHDPSSGADDSSLMAELHVVRRCAQKLLGQLRIDRALAEQRWAEAGRSDPIKSVTGRSAMDNAVCHTERMIHVLEDLPAEIDGQGGDPRGSARTTTPVPVAARS
jgi:hypothetical protein